MWLRRVGIALLICLGGTPAHAQVNAADLKAKILLRALAYDRSLQERAHGMVRVAVLYRSGDAGSVSSKNEMTAAFRALTKLTLLGMPVGISEIDFTSADNLKDTASQSAVSAVFLCAGLDKFLPAILTVTHSAKIASMTDVFDYVQQGASLGVNMHDGGAKLLLNVAASKDEGMSLAAELMNMAEIVP